MSQCTKTTKTHTVPCFPRPHCALHCGLHCEISQCTHSDADGNSRGTPTPPPDFSPASTPAMFDKQRRDCLEHGALHPRTYAGNNHGIGW